MREGRRRPAPQSFTNLQLRFQERIFAADAHNQQEEQSFISRRGGKIDPKNQKNRNKLRSINADLHINRGFASTQSEEKHLSDLVSSRNTNTEDLRQRFCKEHFLTRTNKNSYATCEPHQPTADACILAQ